MKTVPIARPGQMTQAEHSAGTSPAALDARARAMAKLVPAAPKHNPVPIPVDANSISPEDMSAIVPKSGQSDVHVEDTEVVESASSEEVTQEQAPTPPPKVEPVEEKQSPSSQMAILARKERALRAKAIQQEQAIKAREDAIKARELELAAKDQEYQSKYISRDRVKQDLLNVMAEEGLSYDELTQQLIQQQQMPENPRVKAQLAKLEAQNRQLEEKLQKMEQTSVEQQTNSYKAAVKQIETDVKQLVKDNPEYEAINATGSIRDVVELIEETWKKDGVLLTVEEATSEVENYLIEEATKLTKLEKIKKRLNSSASTVKPQPQSQTPVTPKQIQPMKTLTNATSSTRQMSAKERAILAFKGQLKS